VKNVTAPCLDNGKIAELLARRSEEASYPLQRALRRAARLAFIWPEECARLMAEGRSLTEFPGVGPHLEKVIRQWLENPPDVGEIPVIRQNFFTLPQARSLLAGKPVWLTRLKGDLQMHTEWSDGSGTIQQMAEAAELRGYDYIAITDHSKGLKIAGGINEQELAEQGAEIGQVNEGLEESGRTVRVLRSVELNLSPRGEGDLAEETLGGLDLVLGSFHSALRKSEDQTDRYLAALRHPSIHILGHPRGRIYNYRLGLKADWQAVFELAAELDKAVEIDAYPDRQDLSVELLTLARAAGCRISIGTDAHHVWQLEFAELGLAHACKAGIAPDRILNFMEREALVAWAGSVRTMGTKATGSLSRFNRLCG
jgi:histidinol phosphatase-like PHP family hydrolase